MPQIRAGTAGRGAGGGRAHGTAGVARGCVLDWWYLFRISYFPWQTTCDDVRRGTGAIQDALPEPAVAPVLAAAGSHRPAAGSRRRENYPQPEFASKPSTCDDATFPQVDGSKFECHKFEIWVVLTRRGPTGTRRKRRGAPGALRRHRQHAGRRGAGPPGSRPRPARAYRPPADSRRRHISTERTNPPPKPSARLASAIPKSHGRPREPAVLGFVCSCPFCEGAAACGWRATKRRMHTWKQASSTAAAF
jgi:hypothetical protein